MDNTEISNNEYRQFVYWVKDSIAREILYTKNSEWTKGYPTVDDKTNKVTDKSYEKWGDDDATEWINYKEFFLDETALSSADTKYKPFYGNEDAGTAKTKNSKGEVVPAHDEDSRLLYRGNYVGPFLRNKPEEIIFTLNWEKELDYSDENVIPLLAEMYLPTAERYYRRREIDTRKLMYRYFWIDYRAAAVRGDLNIDYDVDPNKGGKSPFNDENSWQDAGDKTNKEHRTLDKDVLPPNPVTGESQSNLDFSKDKDLKKFKGGGQELDLGRFNEKGQNNAIRGHSDRSRFIIDEEINVYPDTLCWVRDFTYTFHDPMSNMYFWHPAYDNYPVVGITWVQAKAFSVWRTQLLNNWLVSEGELFVNDFRLPTEAEWERGARGPNEMNQYPWGGPYIRNNAGCFLGNFKPMRGRYFEDGGFQTVKVYSYNPNNWGLYCMAGNVSEWCETAFDESMYEVQHDLNPDYRYDAKDWDPPVMKRKVIRGGSWKDVGYYLMCGTRTYEYQDTAKSYIGFRNVMTHLGRGGQDITLEGGAEEIQSDIQLR
jgi:formylglycine-generating enzyme required for sulfatase activity